MISPRDSVSTAIVVGGVHVFILEIANESGEIMAMGGLWESWKSPDGEILQTCAIVTTGPNALMQPIHDRMPVILAPEHWQAWLEAPPKGVNDLLSPYPAEPMQAWPVDRRVSRAREDDAGLIRALV